MRKRTTALAAPILAAVMAAWAQGQAALTNQDIVKMIKAGLSEQIVLATITGQPADLMSPRIS